MSDYGPDLYHMLTSSGDKRRRQQDVIVCSTFQASPIHSIDSVLRHDVASRLRRQKLYDERQRLYTEALLSYQIRNAREQNYMLREDEEMLQLDLQLRDLRENRGLRPLPPSPSPQTYRWPQRPKVVVSAARKRERKLVSPMPNAKAEVKHDVISAALEGMIALEELERPADAGLSAGALQGLRRALLVPPSMATVPPINAGAPANKQGDKEPTPQGNLVSHLPRFEPSFGR